MNWKKSFKSSCQQNVFQKGGQQIQRENIQKNYQFSLYAFRLYTKFYGKEYWLKKKLICVSRKDFTFFFRRIVNFVQSPLSQWVQAEPQPSPQHCFWVSKSVLMLDKSVKSNPYFGHSNSPSSHWSQSITCVSAGAFWVFD